MCPTCGTVDDDWVDEQGRKRDDPTYRVEAYRCFGCQQIKEAERELPETGADMDGVFFRMTPADAPPVHVEQPLSP